MMGSAVKICKTIALKGNLKIIGIALRLNYSCNKLQRTPTGIFSYNSLCVIRAMSQQRQTLTF